MKKLIMLLFVVPLHANNIMDYVECGDFHGVKNAIKVGENVNQHSNWGLTPLMIATKSGHEKIIKYLVNQNADMNAVDDSGWTVLFFCS